MIEVHVYRDRERNIVRYCVSGHARMKGVPRFLEYFLRRLRTQGEAGYPKEGYDVVCAAVSSLAQASLVGIRGVVGIQPGVEVEDGYLECILPAEMSPDDRRSVNILLETMVLTMKNFEEKYRKFVRIEEMEV